MPDFKLPLSGDVSQTINPWTVLFNPVGSSRTSPTSSGGRRRMRPQQCDD
jgi:hypothetical protein